MKVIRNCLKGAEEGSIVVAWGQGSAEVGTGGRLQRGFYSTFARELVFTDLRPDFFQWKHPKPPFWLL